MRRKADERGPEGKKEGGRAREDSQYRIEIATRHSGLEEKGKMDVPTDGKTTEELVTEGLALSDGVKTTVLDLLGVELNGALGEAETLLDEGGELADAATLLTEDLLGVGGTDDDLGAGVGDTDLASRVTLRGEGTREELGQLRAAQEGEKGSAWRTGEQTMSRRGRTRRHPTRVQPASVVTIRREIRQLLLNASPPNTA